MKRAHFRIKITRSGWLFIFLTLGVGISALNTGNNLLYLILGTMLSFLILSGLLSNNSLRRLQIQPTFPRRLFAQQQAPVRITLQNRKRFSPSFAIAVKIASPQIRESRGIFVVKVPPQSSFATIDRVYFPRRGLTPLPPYEAHTAYPFGFIRKGLPLPAKGEAVVYPALIDLDTWFGKQRALLGEFLSGERGGFSNPYGIREYVRGDPARLIHWKSSAKLQKWLVKEFEHEKRLRFLLDVRLAPHADSDPKYLERALSAAASLLLFLSKKGVEVELRLNGITAEHPGRSYLDAYLTTLALASPPNQVVQPQTTLQAGMVLTVSDLPQKYLSGDLIFGRERLETL